MTKTYSFRGVEYSSPRAAAHARDLQDQVIAGAVASWRPLSRSPVATFEVIRANGQRQVHVVAEGSGKDAEALVTRLRVEMLQQFDQREDPALSIQLV